MRMPYHPIAAFGLLYIIGLLTLLSVLGFGGLIVPAGVLWLMDSGYVNVLPMAIVFVAARQSALIDGRPFFRFATDDAKTIRRSLQRHIWLWAASFGLAGVTADLASVAVAATVQAQPFHYSMLRLLVIAAAYALIAREGIKSTFGPNSQIAPEAVEDTRRQRPAPVSAEDHPPQR